MTITEAQDYIKSLITEDTKPSHAKIYNKFLNVLDFIDGREFSSEEIISIETHLETLQLKNEAKKKHIYIFKKYSVLTSFLRKDFSLTTEGYHAGVSTGIGMSMGMSLGMCFGIAIFKENGLIYGMIFGMMIGLIFGSGPGVTKDKQAKEDGNVIPNTQE